MELMHSVVRKEIESFFGPIGDYMPYDHHGPLTGRYSGNGFEVFHYAELNLYIVSVNERHVYALRVRDDRVQYWSKLFALVNTSIRTGFPLMGDNAEWSNL